jgi:hypothetical protein
MRLIGLIFADFFQFCKEQKNQRKSVQSVTSVVKKISSILKNQMPNLWLSKVLRHDCHRGQLANRMGR